MVDAKLIEAIDGWECSLCGGIYGIQSEADECCAEDADGEEQEEE